MEKLLNVANGIRKKSRVINFISCTCLSSYIFYNIFNTMYTYDDTTMVCILVPLYLFVEYLFCNLIYVLYLSNLYNINNEINKFKKDINI